MDTLAHLVSVTRNSYELKQLSYPCMVVSDNGTELTSNANLKWQEDRKVEWLYIAPGKPMQNGFVESFNDRLPPSRDIAAQCPAGQWTGASTSTCLPTCATAGS